MDLSLRNSAFKKFTRNNLCLQCGYDSLIYSNNEYVCAHCEQKNCSIDKGYIRLDWKYDKENINKISYEIKKHNSWAKNQIGSLSYNNKPKEDWYDYTIYSSNPPIRERPSALGEVRDVEGWDVLDVGGSCVDSWRFLSAGAASLSQIEPAPESQRLAIHRLEKALSNSGVNWRDRVLFHTVVAEHLPFQDNTFDMVFSRSSIHHTSRPESLKECFRVLKPGGYFLIIEPRYSSFLDWLRLKYRKLRNAERGSDKPLTDDDLSHIIRLSSHTNEIRYKIFNPFEVIFGNYMSSKYINRINNRDVSKIDFLLEKSFILSKK